MSDVVIAGGGIVGLSVGLELLQRGLSVAVVERRQAMRAASGAAGGMLAVHDPQNPRALMQLAVRSRELYPEYLDRVEELSGKRVPLRTRWAMQYVESGHGSEVTAAQLAEYAPGLRTGGQSFAWIEEASLDPVDLREALPAAFRAAGGVLLEGTEVAGVEGSANGVAVITARERMAAGMFVNCCGAWAGSAWLDGLPVVPVKGQMGDLRCAPELLRCVVRAPGVYLISRGDGRVAMGATIERVGFDEWVEGAAVRELAERALRLLPEAEAPAEMEMWAGLRPGTPDGLPILGRAVAAGCWHATGHYRDGMLLGPGTGRVMAQAMLGERTDVELEEFRPERFQERVGRVSGEQAVVTG